MIRTCFAKLGKMWVLTRGFLLSVLLAHIMFYTSQNCECFTKSGNFVFFFQFKLTESSLETASHILQHLGEVMQTTQRRMRSNKKEDRFLLSQEFIEAMTRVTSNLIEASSMLVDRYAHICPSINV